MSGSENKMRFEIVATRSSGESIQIHCESNREFQEEAKELYSDYSIMAVYGFNDNGFVKRVNYIRGIKNWIILR